MARILAIIPDYHHSRTATELLRLAHGLRGLHNFEVIGLKGHGPVAAKLGRAGITAHAASNAQRCDLAVWYRLRKLVQATRPDVIHVWGLKALRALHLSLGGPRCPILLSNPVSTGRRHLRLGPFDRWLLRRCNAVVVPSEAEQQICRDLGAGKNHVELVAPAAPLINERDTQAPLVGPGNAIIPILVCIGPLEVEKGFYEAIWAFDVLRHLHGNLQLWIIGDGPDGTRLRRFVNILGIGHAVRFLGECDDIQPWLRQAVAVWVPSLVDAGHHAVLEAMAAGRPVVASDLTRLAQLVRDGETGFLVPPGKKVGFAKKTRLLIEDPDLAAGLGRAGLNRAQNYHHVSAMTSHYSDLYLRLAG